VSASQERLSSMELVKTFILALKPTQPSVGMKMTTHLHPVQRLRMSGDVPLLRPYAFMACTRTILRKDILILDFRLSPCTEYSKFPLR